MKKFRKKYAIAVLVIALVIIFPLLFLFGRNDKRESNGILWNGKQTIETNYEQSSIAIPGFTKISFEANSTNQKINLYNPDTNTCSMDFSILMPDGSVLWSEENIQPGYGLYDIQLNKELEKGTYEECTFTIRCYKDGVELNGCNIAFTLYVY